MARKPLARKPCGSKALPQGKKKEEEEAEVERGIIYTNAKAVSYDSAIARDHVM